MAHVTLDFFLAADCDLSTWSCTNLVWPMAWASNSKSNCPSFTGFSFLGIAMVGILTALAAGTC